jgi:hypothetical protein
MTKTASVGGGRHQQGEDDSMYRGRQASARVRGQHEQGEAGISQYRGAKAGLTACWGGVMTDSGPLSRSHACPPSPDSSTSDCCTEADPAAVSTQEISLPNWRVRTDTCSSRHTASTA